MRLFILVTAVLGCVSATQDLCSFTTAEEVLTPWLADAYGRLTFPVYNQDPITAIEGSALRRDIDSFNSCGICASENVLCRGRLNETFIKSIDGPVKSLLVTGYNLDQIINNATNNNFTHVVPADFASSELIERTPLDLTSTTTTYKATGDIFSSGVGIGMTFSSTLRPSAEDRFILSGDAFSNELRVGWQVTGDLLYVHDGDSHILEAQVDTVGEGGWSFHGVSYLHNTSETTWNWNFNGTVKSPLLLAPISFSGTLLTSLGKNAYIISGEAIVNPLLVKWQVTAVFTASTSEYITIPSDLFSGMQIQHLYFKDSYFMGDFDRDALQGINGLETVTFTNSKLEEIPRLDYLFRSMDTIKAIYLEGTSMPNLLTGSLPTLTNLELLSLKGSGPLQFTNTSTYWLAGSKLTWLNLQDCNVNVDIASETGVLEALAPSLRYLDLSYTSLTRKEALEGMLRGLKLTHLSLAGLQLTQLPRTALQYVNESLRFLSVRRNKFQKVPEENLFSVVLDFPIMAHLEELDLASCGINYIEAGVFDNLPGLKKLILAHNKVDNVQDGWYLTKPQLRYIDMSWNGENIDRAEFSLQPGEGLAYLSQLEMVDFSNAVFTYTDTMVKSLSRSTRILSLCNTGLQAKDSLSGLQLPAVTLLDISGNPNVEYGSIEVATFIHSLQNLRSLYARNNKITNSFFNIIHALAEAKNVSVFIPSLNHLDLSGNIIKTLSGSFFSIFPNLTYVDLSANSIAAWSAPLNLPNKANLMLSDNKIETVTSAMMHDLFRLNSSEIGKNPFVCNCDIYQFANAVTFSGSMCDVRGLNNSFSSRRTFLMRTKSCVGYRPRLETKCVSLNDWANGTNYYCYGSNNSEDIRSFAGVKNDSDLCFVTQDTPITKDAADNFNALYVGIAVLIVLSLAAGFVYWKWYEIRLMTRAVRHAAILTFMDKDEPEEPRAIKYHAFVSYCEKDRPWVLQQMLPQLEQWNEVCVCLHERDFQVGVSIMENITSSMDESRHLVLVLSQSFVLSQWCQFELQLAQHRLIESKRDKLVLILLEPIPRYKKTKTLRYLMRTNTYIEWPRDGNKIEIDRFWDRLLQAIR